MKYLIVVFGMVSMLLAGNASAVGIGDLVSAGINVVGKVGGAMIEKATEDNPEELAAKQNKERLEQEVKFKEVLDKIEARKDISPLEKEKLTRAAAKNFGAAEAISNLAVQQELQRRAERDQMLSSGGIAGVVGNAALNTPSAIMAKADLMVKTGQPQAQSKAAVDAAVAATNGKSGAVGQRDVGTVELGGTGQDKAIAREGVLGAIAQNGAEIERARAALEAAKPKDIPATSHSATHMATMDRDRNIYIEFVGSPTLSRRLVQAFRDGGYSVVTSAEEAEAIYQFDAEYAIAEEPSREGTLVSVGRFVEDGKPIELKAKGSSIKRTIGGFLLSAGGVAVPERKDSGVYRQAALFVVNRHADGKDLRVAERYQTDTAELNPALFIDGALLDLMGMIGLPGKLIQVESPPANATPVGDVFDKRTD